MVTDLYRVPSLSLPYQLRTLPTNVLQLVICIRYNLTHLRRMLPLDRLYIIKCSIHKALPARGKACIARLPSPLAIVSPHLGLAFSLCFLQGVFELLLCGVRGIHDGRRARVVIVGVAEESHEAATDETIHDRIIGLIRGPGSRGRAVDSRRRAVRKMGWIRGLRLLP